MQKVRNKLSPKISIVIPSFNKVKYIQKTLDSIFGQKYNNLEVIVQDGGSTDGTLNIIRSYAQKYPKQISFESKPDGGQLKAINVGLGKATGELLTYINADDVYVDGAFLRISNKYAICPKALWFSGLGAVINSEGNEIAKPVTLYKNILHNLNKYPFLLSTNYLIQPSVFFTNVAYKQHGPFTGTDDFVMEYDFWLKLGSIEMPVIINSLLSNFRIEESTKTKLLFEKLLSEDEKIVRRYTSNKLILLIHKLNNFGRVFVEKFL